MFTRCDEGVTIWAQCAAFHYVEDFYCFIFCDANADGGFWEAESHCCDRFHLQPQQGGTLTNRACQWHACSLHRWSQHWLRGQSCSTALLLSLWPTVLQIVVLIFTAPGYFAHSRFAICDRKIKICEFCIRPTSRRSNTIVVVTEIRASHWPIRIESDRICNQVFAFQIHWCKVRLWRTMLIK